MTDYAEFRLRIERGAEPGLYRVEASALGGSTTGAFRRPFTDTDLENFILKVGRTRRGVRRIESPEWELAKTFGAKLFAATVHGPVAELYRSAYTQARASGQGLRITLALTDAPEVGAIPWEYLYDDPSFLSISSSTPVVRYLDLPRPRPALPVELPIRILGVVSAPSGVEALKTDVERAKLEAALKPLVDAGAVAIDWLEEANLLALTKRLRSDNVHILHYIGHGGFDDANGQGALLLEDDQGRGRVVSGEQLATVLQDRPSLRLVFLNSCEGARNSVDDPFSGVATSLVERDIPAVIGMQFEITDRAAVVFASEFYAMLAEGRPVDAAVTEARLAIFADHNDVEWATPVLYMRVADGRLFDVANAGAIARGNADALVAAAVEAAPELAAAVVEPVAVPDPPLPDPPRPVVPEPDPPRPVVPEPDPPLPNPPRPVVPEPVPPEPHPVPVPPAPGRWARIRHWIRAHWRPLGVGALAIVILLVAAYVRLSGPSAGEVRVTARPGVATVLGSGFNGFEPVAIFLDDSDVIVDVTADETGAFKADVPIGDRVAGTLDVIGGSGRKLFALFFVLTQSPTPSLAANTAPPVAAGCAAREPAPVPARPESPGVLFYSHPNDADGNARIYFLPGEDVPSGTGATPVELGTGKFPTWSPDHSQVAFSRRGELRIASFVDGRLEGERNLTTGPGDYFPTWSAHGCIAFVRGGPEPGIWLVSPDKSFEERLVAGSSVGAPDWSPDGLTLAYMRNVGSGNHDIETVSLLDPSQRSLLMRNTAEVTPKWSPDGLRLAYARGEAGSNRQDIYVAGIEWRDGIPVATGSRQLTDTDPDAANPALRDSNPAWSPDGDSLVWYRADEETRAYRIWTMGIASEFSTATQLTGDERNYIDPVWR